MSSEAKYVELDGVAYRRQIHHGYYTLRPVVDGKISQREISEHRLVYQVANGVDLDDDVHIHHLNRDKTDNRPENLIALSKSDHNRLHAFEDRSCDMKLLKGLEDKARLHKRLSGIGSRDAVSNALSKLVAYGSAIYHRVESEGFVYLCPLVDGRIDYSVRIPEHRLVYEISHGKTLPEGAIVKHINGDRSDNRPENLAYNGLISSRVSKKSGSKIPTNNKGEKSRKGVGGKQPTEEVLGNLIAKYSNQQIAKMFDVSASAVASWRKKCGLPSANEQHGWKRGAKASKHSENTLSLMEVVHSDPA